MNNKTTRFVHFEYVTHKHSKFIAAKLIVRCLVAFSKSGSKSMRKTDAEGDGELISMIFFYLLNYGSGRKCGPIPWVNNAGHTGWTH